LKGWKPRQVLNPARIPRLQPSPLPALHVVIDRST
jgi:hypothetical protein